MARAVAAAMKADEPLLFEAGTGVGKSLAYLLPGIIHAVSQSRQLNVSTHTISLQEQLETKDLPLCRKFFSAVDELKPYVAFKSTVLVGKSNYLCTTRLAYALADRASLFSDDDYTELQRIADWAEGSADRPAPRTAFRSPRPGSLEPVNADSSACSRNLCNWREMLLSARPGAAALGTRHHRQSATLLFALINAGGAQAQGDGQQRARPAFPG